MLAGYAVVYCLPCLVLLTIGIVAAHRTRAALSRIVDRFGSGDVKQSPSAAVVLIAVALAVASLPYRALG